MARDLGEFLIPRGSFKGPTAETDLRNARCTMLLVYLGYLLAFVYLLATAFVSGRMEVLSSQYKVDVIEAPSVAVCPFWPGTAIVPPDRLVVAEDQLIEVYKYTPAGEEKLRTRSRSCTYDRECVCVDLFDAEGGPVQFHDHLQREVSNIGTTGAASESEMIFRERIEARTNVTDPSKDGTLKVGFYDSVDPRPHWFYMQGGTWMLGKLELETWAVSDLSWQAIWEAVKRLDYTNVHQIRHIFRYTSYDGGTGHGSSGESFVSYQMSNFFIEHQMSSEAAFSPYTLLFLLAMVVMYRPVIGTVQLAMFPELDPHKGETKVLEMSPAAAALNTCCMCFCCFPSSGESEPLVSMP